MMRTTFFILSGLLIMGGVAACTPSASGPVASITGKWVIGQTHYCPHICAMDDAQAGTYAGRKLHYSASRVSSGQTVCASPKYSVEKLSKEDFYTDYKFMPSDIGLNELPVVRLSIDCDGQGWPDIGSTVLLKNEKTIIAVWDGVFFEAHPANGSSTS